MPTNTYSLDYLIQRTGRAVEELATGFEPGRTRLSAAYGALTGLLLTDYPEPLREKRAEIDRWLTRFSGREGFLVTDNIRKMKKQDVSRVCELILELHLDLLEQRYLQDKHRRISP